MAAGVGAASRKMAQLQGGTGLVQLLKRAAEASSGVGAVQSARQAAARRRGWTQIVEAALRRSR